jgi:hypothetical protein
VAVPELSRDPMAGDGATTHAAVLELACARSGSRGHGARGGPEATMGPDGRSQSYETRGGSGAVVCQEMGAAGDAGM